jgi:hypothetical protein
MGALVVQVPPSEVKTRDDPSLNVPMAVNCWVWPTLMVESAGVTVMEVKEGGPILAMKASKLPPL